jgi:hypothetical protein
MTSQTTRDTARLPKIDTRIRSTYRITTSTATKTTSPCALGISTSFHARRPDERVVEFMGGGDLSFRRWENTDPRMIRLM